jgi:two-component system sensor histidine kinase ChvG
LHNYILNSPLLAAFPGIRRRDEIGDLAGALDDLTHRLSAHIALLEGSAADVAHEFKNPLAAIRSAAETIDACDDPGERSRFVAFTIRDVSRLERLVSGLRELARIDVRLPTG